MPSTAQVIQQLFRRDKIGGTETLREAIVDRPEAADRVGGSALIAQQACEARPGAQFPGERILPSCELKRVLEACFSTKIHVHCSAAGLPIGIVLSEGEAHDATAYGRLMQQRDSDPGAMSAEKGYDSEAIRHDLWDSGATPETPTKSNRKVQYLVSKPLYALRSRIECFIGHLKEQRRIATRYDKLATSFIGFVLLGCIRIWARFVHKA